MFREKVQNRLLVIQSKKTLEDRQKLFHFREIFGKVSPSADHEIRLSFGWITQDFSSNFIIFYKGRINNFWKALKSSLQERLDDEF